MPLSIRDTIRRLPTLFAFLVLGGVLAYGHHNHWKAPSFAALTGKVTSTEDAWCESHQVPEALCIECDDSLTPKIERTGFCREHGVHDCVIHHPELSQTLTSPHLPRYDTVQALASRHRNENNSRNTLHASRVQLVSRDAADRLGIEVAVVQEKPMIEFLSAPGEIQFDPSRIGHLSSRAPGTIHKVLKSIGDRVRAGEMLALVDAASVGKLKSDYLQSVVQLQLRTNTLQRLTSISQSGALPQKAWIEAESALQEAEVALVAARQAIVNLGFEIPNDWNSVPATELSDRLRFLGLPETILADLPQGTKTANLLPLITPYDGMILSSDMVTGEVVDSGKVLATVCDPDRMWLVLRVRQEDMPWVALGQHVRFRSDDQLQRADGKIQWISPTVDEATRTVEVRVALDASHAGLRDKMFGTGRILLREEPNAVVVPNQAIQTTHDATFVFVRDRHYFDDDAPKFFHVRQVRIGAQDDSHTELLAGVLPGEIVATQGSYMLLSQLLRSHLGAGCGCHDH